jgi:hypothetical protein
MPSEANRVAQAFANTSLPDPSVFMRRMVACSGFVSLQALQVLPMLT